MSSPRDVVILGATGSIGRQAIDIIERNPDRFRAVALSASGSNPAALAEDAIRLRVSTVGVARATAAEDILLHLRAAASRHDVTDVPRVIAGPEVNLELAGSECDVVLNGVAGSVGLGATLQALESGRTLALANKESLVAGGPLVTRAAAPGQIVPVDSEHSAMAQCLRAGRRDEVRRFILTASGGPFRGRSAAELAGVTLEQAMAHPTWQMGQVVTINSATLVNKGLELIEAHLLFDVPPDDIVVAVHPQSIVHSMIEYVDGSTIAQASPPDMRLPIALALGWPDRVPEAAPALDWSTASAWSFEPVDDEVFPAVRLARAAAATGGLAPATYNAANEEAVAAFAAGRIGFLDIVATIDAVLEQLDGETDLSRNPVSLTDVTEHEKIARARAGEQITRRAEGRG